MKIVATLRNDFPLKDILYYLGIPRSTYYYKATHPKKDKHEKTRRLIRKAYEKSKGIYGYRRITYALERDYGLRLNRKTIARLMQEEGLKARQKRKNRYTSYRGTIGRVADNHLKRNFHAERPFQKLVSDITEFHIGSEKVYLSPLIDLYNGEIVSWRIGRRPNMEMVLGMLSDVYPLLCREKPTIHTDQGLQYQQPLWQNFLKEAGCTPSMSRKGNCLDNAAAESFFGKVKTEFSNGSDFKCAKHFMRKLDKWMHWYNEGRIKETLSGMSPAEYRIMKNPPALESVQD